MTRHDRLARTQHLSRGGAPAGARPPRLRGVRRAARDRDPARRLPARHDAARRSASWPSGCASRGRRCARRWPRCAQAGLVETTRGRGGGTVVTLKPRTPSARAAAARAQPRRSARTGSTRWTSAASSSPAPPRWPRRARAGRRTTARSSSRRTPRSPHARKPAEHRQADSRFHLTIASLTGSPRIIEAVTSVQATLHEMLLRDPGARGQHRPLRPAARRGSSRAILAGRPGPGPPGHGGALRRHGRAAARPARMSRAEPDWTGDT